jgi:hypothetical protein
VEEPDPAKLLVIPLGFGVERVRVSISMPLMAGESNTVGLLEALVGGERCIVEIDRSDLSDEVIAKYETKRNTPDLSGRYFHVLLCQDQSFRFLLPITKPEKPIRNPWIMRDEFLNLRKETRELQAFLNRWGWWWSSRGYSVFQPSHDFVLIHPHQLWRLQDDYRRALTGSARSWLRMGAFLNLTRNDVPPYFFIETSHCEEGIEATITIDKLSNVNFGICKRGDCRKLFEFTTKQRRLYCTPHCAHLANVRKLREQKKKARKGRKSNAKS